MQVMAPLCSFIASFMEVVPVLVMSHTLTCPSPPPLISLLLLEVQARAVTPYWRGERENGTLYVVI